MYIFVCFATWFFNCWLTCYVYFIVISLKLHFFVCNLLSCGYHLMDTNSSTVTIFLNVVCRTSGLTTDILSTERGDDTIIAIHTRFPILQLLVLPLFHPLNAPDSLPEKHFPFVLCHFPIAFPLLVHILFVFILWTGFDIAGTKGRDVQETLVDF